MGSAQMEGNSPDDSPPSASGPRNGWEEAFRQAEAERNGILEMVKVPISTLKKTPGRVIDMAFENRVILITRYGKPVVGLVSITDPEDASLTPDPEGQVTIQVEVLEELFAEALHYAFLAGQSLNEFIVQAFLNAINAENMDADAW